MRLSLAFMAIILLTGLIGALAIWEFSSLTSTTTELNSHDLPEAIVLVHLRSQLYRQRDFEQQLLAGVSSTHGSSSTSDQQDPFLSGAERVSSTNIVLLSTPESTPTASGSDERSKQMQSNLTTTLNEIAGDRQQLLKFEQPDQKNMNPKDLPLVRQVADDILKTRALSERIQALVQSGQLAQARTLDVKQQEPLLASAINAVSQLVTIEQNEASNGAAQVQLESWRSSFSVFALTALGLLLSIVLATIITRSLTRPLKVLLRTTEAIAAGDLTVEPQAERTDEIGGLASAYDKMRLSLRSTIASLKQERQQTQAIIDATADGVILVDAAHKIVACNPASERLSGWRAEETTGRYCWEVLGFKESNVKEAAPHEPLFALQLALQNTSEPTYLEMSITSRTGQQRWLAISCAPMPPREQEEQHHMVIGLHDISQLKAVEQMKSNFVTMVSHELRAPLTTVTGSVEMLSVLDPGADTEAYHEVLNILDQQTRRLRQVVEEVLQITRFDAGRLKASLQPLPLSSFLHGLVEKMRAEWSTGDHCFILHEPAEEIEVWADSVLLEIVLRNLFDNARKYAPQGSPIEIETDVTASNGQFEVRVVDHGSGIPEDQLEHIFERFSRGTQSSYSWTRGYGLGLYIARELMLAHNGTIRAENRSTGACFTLSLLPVTGDHQVAMKGTTQSHIEEQAEEIVL